MATNSDHAPTAFGATIVPTTATEKQPPTTLSALDSPALTPSPSNEDFTGAAADRIPPVYSPFYEHDRALSRDTLRPTTTTQTHEKDLEHGLVARDPESPFTSRVNVGCAGSKEDGMWPSKQTLLRGRAAEKKRRRDRKLCGGCGPVVEFWAARSKRQRLLIKLAIALLVLGLAVTIGLCISIAVHGTFYKRPGQQQPIVVN